MLKLLGFSFGWQSVLIALGVASLVAGFGGWQVRDAFCDAAKAKADLAAEQRAHAATKVDLNAAQNAAKNTNKMTGWLEGWSAKREETIRELPAPPASTIDCRKLGADGLKWLRRVGPD